MGILIFCFQIKSVCSPKELALGPILIALHLWEVTPSGKNRVVIGGLAKPSLRRMGQGTISEWLRLGIDVGALQGQVALVAPL